MPTVEQVARAALRDLGNEPGLVSAAAWVQERYEELCSRRLKHLSRRCAITVPAAITAGTANVTRGSDIVLGDATAQAAWNAASQDIVGRYFQAGNVWLKIVELTSTPTLRLEAVYTEASNTAASYKVVQRHAVLPEDVQYLATYAENPRRRRKLWVCAPAELDLSYPERTYFAGGPDYLVDMGIDEGKNARLVEIYPYSTQAETITLRYWAKPKKYALRDELPSFITVVDLKEGVLIDAMRWKMNQALGAKDKEGAAHWRNEYRAQETRWRATFLPQLVKRDQAVEDLALVMRSGMRQGMRDVRTARDEIFIRGNRP